MRDSKCLLVPLEMLGVIELNCHSQATNRGFLLAGIMPPSAVGGVIEILIMRCKHLEASM